MMKRRILITGSSGMLGIDLCQELRRSYDVIGMDLAKSPASNVRRLYKADITDRRAVDAVVTRVNPDVIVHSAAWTDVDGCERDAKKAYRINANGTGNVALACKKAGATLVYISTDFVFHGKKRTPYKETDKVRPLSVYGDSKLKGEEAVRKTLKEYFILRTSWLYGKHGKNFVDTIAAKAKTEDCLKVVRDQVGSPTYTKYLAKAIHSLIDLVCTSPQQAGRGYGIYHVSNSGRVSWYDYARMITALTKARAKVTPITARELARPAKRPAMSVMDNAKFAVFTGYRMPAWKIALKDYLSKK